MTRRLSLAAILGIIGGAARAGAAEPAAMRPVDIELRGAVFHGETAPPREERRDLVLYLGRRGGEWTTEFMAWAGMRTPGGNRDDRGRWFNQMDHLGTVTEVTDAEGTVRMTVEVDVKPDPWVPGGAGRYTLEFTPEGDHFQGTFSGTFRGQEVQGVLRGKVWDRDWPAAVEGWRPFEPGEHPRVLFRKEDVPGIRERAATPEGRAIVERLRLMLGGGEAMPTRFQSATDAYGGGDRNLPVGAYTLWHGMGFGMLYQLTGEAKYADLARQCVQKALDGQRDRDQRYAFVRPGGKLRAGSSFAAIAMAYDLCYDAWDEDFRAEVARRVLDAVIAPGGATFTDEKAMAEPVDGDLVFNTMGGQHSPHSNHYGAWNGGGGTAILAILGDPGVDPRRARLAHRVFLQRARRALEVGYGDTAYFFEGHHGGRLNSNTGLITYLHALRVAEGLDFVEPFSGGEWLVSKWMYEIVRDGSTLRSPMQGIYAADHFERGGMSTGGDFARGFAIVPEAHRGALRWFYENEIEPEPPRTYDAIRYPHHAVFALLFWPIGEPAVNPGEVLPRYLGGPGGEPYFVFRSGWTGGGDVIATGYNNDGFIQGLGLNQRWIGGPAQPHTVVEDIEDGLACLVRTPHRTFAADMSGLSGAPLLFLTIDGLGQERRPDVIPPDDPLAAALRDRFRGGPGPAQPRPALGGELRGEGENVGRDDGTSHILNRRTTLSGFRVTVTTVQQGPGPRFTVEDDRLTIGRRAFRIDGEQLVFERVGED